LSITNGRLNKRLPVLFDDPKDIISMSSQTADGFMDKSTSNENWIPPFFFFLKLNHRCCCWSGIFLCCAHWTGVYSVYYTEIVTHRAKPSVSGFYIPLNDLVFLVIIFASSR
jgi:hypothetical protein